MPIQDRERQEYELSEDDYQELLKASRPTRAMFLSGGILMGGSPQENANRVWQRLGYKMRFEPMTVKPSPKGERFFTAIPRPLKLECQCGYIHEIITRPGKHTHICPDCGVQEVMDGERTLCSISYGDK